MTETKIPEEYTQKLLKQGFKLEKRIDSGLSGAIYLGTQPSLSRKVAVKFFDSIISLKDNALRKRFIREAHILAKLQHPSIPYVITHNEVSRNGYNVPYTVMQYIEGQTLESIIKKHGKIDPTESINYIRQILNVLSFIHSNGVIHRDIKPSNIMLLNSGHCYLIDFSIGVSLIESPGLSRATNSGEHLGSVTYMAPEQTKDMKNIDRRADIYSLGIVLFELLTGSSDRTDMSLAMRKLPVSLRSAVLKACDPNPDKRFDSADDFLRAVGGSLNNQVYLKGSPAKAYCSNLKCPDAVWSPQRYFKGPNIVTESTNSYCTSCGEELIYQCPNCGADFDDKPFCGNCGESLFTVPVCEQCGSHLQVGDIGTDTNQNGCQKCRRIRETSNNNFENEDIPF